MESLNRGEGVWHVVCGAYTIDSETRRAAKADRSDERPTTVSWPDERETTGEDF